MDASNFEGRFFEGIDRPKRVREGSHFTDLTEATVILAIAAVWRGLDEAGIRFSFGDAALFRGARTTQDPLVTAVSPSDSLIMPLFFRQGEAGNNRDHHVLAIAERIGHHGRIHLSFMCSHLRYRSEKKEVLEFPVRQEIILEVAQNIVRNSGWMPNNMKPIFNDSYWQIVPDAVATTGVAAVKDTSAYQVVLNAWAYMLDIPINTRHARNVRRLSDPLYETTLAAINMALDGRMDSRTIRHFLLEMDYGLNTHGRRLGKIGDVDERQNQRRVLDGTRAFLMSDEIFDRVIKAFRASPNQALAQGISRASTSEKPNVVVGPAEGTGGVSKQPAGTQSPTKAEIQQISDLLTAIKPPPSKDPQPGPTIKTDWIAKFRSSHRSFMTQMRKVKPFPLKIEGNIELHDEHIFSAIGAIWHPLWEIDVKFSLATSSTCMMNRHLDRLPVSSRAIAGTGGQYPLIIPLLGHGDNFVTNEELSEEQIAADEKKDKNKKPKQGEWIVEGGHYVLIVADRIAPEGDNIRLRLWNSFPTYTTEAAIRPVATTLIQQIGWLDFDMETNTPVVASPNLMFEAQHALVQPQGTNSCGLHVVLNAWAVMLNIQTTGSRREGVRSDNDFCKIGNEVLNCVMAGCYDTETIRSFMVAYGCAVNPDNANSSQPLVQVNAVRMTDAILTPIIRAIIDEEQVVRFTSIP